MRPNQKPLRGTRRTSAVLALGLLCLSNVAANATNATEATKAIEQAKLTVKGVVLDENGDPVIGASVFEGESKNGTITNADGNFSIEVPKGAKLKISYLGYTTATVTANGTGIRVVLQPSDHELNEVVVTALGIKREKKALG